MSASASPRSVSSPSAKAASRVIWCCGCASPVNARLTDGREIYPHRKDLRKLPFWKCDKCKNFVGCHHKTKNRTNPLGCIPTPEIKNARQHIHRVLDPIWRSGTMTRNDAYAAMADALGKDEYHTADLSDLDECRAAYRAAQALADRRNEDRTESGEATEAGQ